MTRDQKIYRLAYWTACVIIAVVLLAAVHKVVNPAEFALAVYRFHLLPGFLVNIVSLYLQWLELVCAVGLLFVPKYRSAILWIVLMLLALFTGGVVINLLRGSVFSCGCFSVSPLAYPMSWLSVARNAALLGLTGLALYSSRKIAD